MKILLLRPYWPYPYSKGEHTYNRIWPPLSLANCAAILEKQGHKVTILDAHALRIKPVNIEFYIRGFDKIFVTSSTLDRWQCPNIDISTFIETVQNIKKLTDEIYVMGYHGTVDPKYILDKTSAKAVIRGSPEAIVSEICQNKNLIDIRGISFEIDSAIFSNLDREEVDLETLPLPAYHLLDTKKYTYEILGENFTLFELSRGCKYSCKFCSKIMYRNKIITKSSDQIIAEIRTAVENNGAKTGYFIDLEFLANKEIVNDICDFLISKKYNFKWCCQTRPDSLNMEILNKMKNADCALIHLGIESGIQEFLNLLGKNITLDTIMESVKMCKNAGIKTLGFYIFGLKGETATDREKIYKFAKNLDTDFISFKKAYPYEHEQNDIYLPNVTSNKEIDKFIRRAYLRYYVRWTSFRRLNMATILRGLKLLCGRILTLR